MVKKYVKHIVQEGSRFHVISWYQFIRWSKKFSVEICSEPNCEINKEYDKLKAERII